MNPPDSARVLASAAVPPAAARARSCLIVHDDPDLRAKLAGLVCQATGVLDLDSLDRASFERLPIERIRAYRAALFIFEFSARSSAWNPFAVLGRLCREAPAVPLFVFARGGDERSAARSMKAGASDYWPIHAVDVAELRVALAHLQDRPREDATSRLSGSSTASGAKSAASTPGTAELRELPKIAGYRVLKKIAHSSAATVYLARNEDLVRPVALKIQPLKKTDGVDEGDRQRFARECKILSSLNHRSIADVVDYGITPEYLYLAIEYFPCGSLRERLRNPLSESDALNYARQIGEALRVVHAKGIVHRDLKPSNLMMTDDNRIVLIDFGLARTPLIASDITSSDLRTGTPLYMSPEQISGKDPDERGDLYSLGVLMFEMLAGAVPFNGATVAEILEGHNHAEVPRLPQHLHRYQPVIDRLLAKDLEARYSSAADFLDGLSTVDGSLPVTIRRPVRQGVQGS